MNNPKVGRNNLFNILRKHDMLTLRKKYNARTTNSLHNKNKDPTKYRLKKQQKTQLSYTTK